MLELLSPAACPEAVTAAVQCGADAVYAAVCVNENARNRNGMLTESEFAAAAEYCRIRGAKIYADLSMLFFDNEMPALAEYLKRICRMGADAVMLSDPGAVIAAKQAAPELAVHAVGQMDAHNLAGAAFAASLGAGRVSIAKELPKENLAYICRELSIETQVTVHGVQCISFSGTCCLGAVSDRRGESRGVCSAPCRGRFSLPGKSGHLLSLKDSCLAGQTDILKKCGVTSLKISGTNRPPEYTALATSVFAAAIKDNKAPSQAQLQELTRLFSQRGLTDALFRGKLVSDMFSADENMKYPDIPKNISEAYLRGEVPRVPVKFYAMINAGEPAQLAVQDERGITLTVKGPVPVPSFEKELTIASMSTRICNLCSSLFRYNGIKATVAPGMYVPDEDMDSMCADLLKRLAVTRRDYKPRAEGEFHAGLRYLNPEDPPVVNISVTRAAQLTGDLARMRPAALYVPLEEIAAEPKRIMPFWDNGETEIVAALPPVIFDNELGEIRTMLKQAAGLQIKSVLVANPGHIKTALDMGFEVRGDFGLKIFNSQALKAYRDAGLSLVTLPFELKFSQIRNISKAVPAELIVYGRIPLMVTQPCIMKAALGRCACDSAPELRDKNGIAYPLLKSFGCRNTIYDSRKLYFADKMDELSKLGLTGVRLAFTTENPVECVQVTERYLGNGAYEPGNRWRGLYYKGTEGGGLPAVFEQAPPMSGRAKTKGTR